MGASESTTEVEDEGGPRLREEGSKLYREFSKMSNGDKRVSVKTLRESEL